jgi:hypothetical protein
MEAAYSVTLSTHVWARHCSDRLNPPQKTFAYRARALPQRARPINKSFCFFFQKEALSFLFFK